MEDRNKGGSRIIKGKINWNNVILVLVITCVITVYLAKHWDDVKAASKDGWTDGK